VSFNIPDRMLTGGEKAVHAAVGKSLVWLIGVEDHRHLHQFLLVHFRLRDQQFYFLIQHRSVEAQKLHPATVAATGPTLGS